jgi:hypothetical protein
MKFKISVRAAGESVAQLSYCHVYETAEFRFKGKLFFCETNFLFYIHDFCHLFIHILEVLGSNLGRIPALQNFSDFLQFFQADAVMLA